MAAGMEPRGVRGPGRGHTDSPDAPGGQAAPRDAAAADAAAGLVERFDIEPYSDFSTKWANFIGLVLFCIDAKFCN